MFRTVWDSPLPKQTTTIAETLPPPPPPASPTTFATLCHSEVTQFYQNILQRSPDPGGLHYWTNEITSGALTPAAVDSAITTSPEAQTWVDPIVRMYTVLGRAPDQAGLSGWVHAYEAGDPISAIGLAFISSPEAQEGIYGNTIPTAATSAAIDTSVVDDLYKEVLGRAADPGGQAFWVDMLQTGTMSIGTVVSAIVNSPEAINRDAGPVTNFLIAAGNGDAPYGGNLFAPQLDRAAYNPNVRSVRPLITRYRNRCTSWTTILSISASIRPSAASRPASSASRSLVCLPGAYRSHHAACCWRIAMCNSLATALPTASVAVLLRSISSNVAVWPDRNRSACRTWSCVPVNAGIGSVAGADKPDLSRQCGNAGAAPPTVRRRDGLSPEPFTVAFATCSTVWRISLECGPDQNRHSPATYRQAASRCCFIASTKWPANASTLGPTGSLSARMNASTAAPTAARSVR